MSEGQFYQFQVKTIDGKDYSFEDLRGKVVMIVNVASHCGFTKQYTGLEKLYETYKERNFVVLGFPCNQFAGQEPGSDEEIHEFCSRTYNVNFPMFSKVEVNGNGSHPLFVYLKEKAPGILGTEGVKWNFTKFLVSKDGKSFKRYAPSTEPESIAKDIEEWL